jgi:hypothetical protein
MFSEICDSGCPLNGGNLTKAQLKGLPKRLRALAEIIAALNATLLAPSNE